LKKYARQTGFIFPTFRGENKKYLKQPTWQTIGRNVGNAEVSLGDLNCLLGVIASCEPKNMDEKNNITVQNKVHLNHHKFIHCNDLSVEVIALLGTNISHL